MDARRFYFAGGHLLYPDSCAYACSMPDANNAYLHRTFGAGDQKKWAFSLWWYPYSLGRNPQLLTMYAAGLQTSLQVYFDNTITFYSNWTDGGFYLKASGAITQKWNHLYVAMDTAQAAASDRLKMYLNKNLITDYGTETYPAQNSLPGINSANVHTMAGVAETSYSDDIYAAPVFVDGAIPDITTFGQDSPEDGSWVYKEPTGLTFGTNGFCLDFALSADMGNDVSGNNNDWTLTNIGAGNQTTTTPTNP